MGTVSEMLYYTAVLVIMCTISIVEQTNGQLYWIEGDDGPYILEFEDNTIEDTETIKKIISQEKQNTISADDGPNINVVKNNTVEDSESIEKIVADKKHSTVSADKGTIIAEVEDIEDSDTNEKISSEKKHSTVSEETKEEGEDLENTNEDKDETNSVEKKSIESLGSDDELEILEALQFVDDSFKN